MKKLVPCTIATGLLLVAAAGFGETTRGAVIIVPQESFNLASEMMSFEPAQIKRQAYSLQEVARALTANSGVARMTTPITSDHVHAS